MGSVPGNQDRNLREDFPDYLNLVGNSQRGGGKTDRAIGGGETYHKAPPPKPVLEASEGGICLVCARFL